MTIGEVIYNTRISMGMTQSKLALLANINHTTISKIEAGLATPSITTINKLAEAFMVTPNVLLTAASMTNTDIPIHPILADIMLLLKNYSDEDLTFVVSMIRLYDLHKSK